MMYGTFRMKNFLLLRSFLPPCCRISQLTGESPEVKRGMQHHSLEPQQLQSEMTPEKGRSASVIHAPIPTPPMDDMEPQSISFIGKCLCNWAVLKLYHDGPRNLTG
jgi:hypothetical protein